jgi:hypothetical protein
VRQASEFLTQQYIGSSQGIGVIPNHEINGFELGFGWHGPFVGMVVARNQVVGRRAVAR